MTAVNVAAYFAFRFTDRLGRRKLAIGGYADMAVSAVVAAAGLAFFTATPRIIVVMIGLDAFIAAFAVGVGGTGWLIQGEVFPTAVRGHCFAALCLLAIAFTARYLPETKGHSVEEITRLFGREAKAGARATAAS